MQRPKLRLCTYNKLLTDKLKSLEKGSPQQYFINKINIDLLTVKFSDSEYQNQLELINDVLINLKSDNAKLVEENIKKLKDFSEFVYRFENKAQISNLYSKAFNKTNVLYKSLFKKPELTIRTDLKDYTEVYLPKGKYIAVGNRYYRHGIEFAAPSGIYRLCWAEPIELSEKINILELNKMNSCSWSHDDNTALVYFADNLKLRNIANLLVKLKLSEDLNNVLKQYNE